MRLTLDTDVIVAAARSRTGASNELLRRLLAGQLEVIASVAMMLEYEAVLMREEHRDVTGWTPEETGRFLDGLAVLIQPVMPHFLWRPKLRDPDDEMVLDAAVNGRVDAIVTFNRRDFLPEAADFQLEVLTPAEVLRRLDGTNE